MYNLVDQAAKDYDMTVEEVKKVIGEKHISLEEFYERLEKFIKNRAELNA